MDISIIIKETDEQLNRKILIEIRNQLRSQLGTVYKEIENVVKDYISFSIKGSDFYSELLYGKLRTELGVVDPSLAMSQIIDALRGTAMVSVGDVRIHNSLGVYSKIEIKAVPDDFSAALTSPLAQYTSANGHLVPWLSWVLFEGTTPVVLNYNLVYGRYLFSRTGDAIMRTSPGNNWGVPNNVAGTVRNNFITRSLNQNINKLEELLDALLKRKLN